MFLCYNVELVIIQFKVALIGVMSCIVKSTIIKNSQSNLCSPLKTMRKPRLSQPNIIIDDHPFSVKKQKEQSSNKHKHNLKQHRMSETAYPDHYFDNFFSPQHHHGIEINRQGYHSNKKNTKIKTQCSPTKQLTGQSLAQRIENKNSKPQLKNRKNPIENHKQTLNKIQEMLISYGVSLKKDNKERHSQQQNSKKSVKSPRFSATQQKQNEKKTKYNQKLTDYFPIIQQLCEQSIQLKQTVSTRVSYMHQYKTKISEFILGKQMGKGKFGTVRVAIHKQSGFIFCIKMISKQVIEKQKIQEQLIREIKIQSFLNSPNVVKLYDVFDDAENIYLLLELCCSGNLYQYMRRKGKLTENQTRVLMRSICEGVAELHENNIIHRDFKPQNIVLSFGMTKICDFGWSAPHNKGMRQTFCGTPLYVSPELLSGKSYNEKVDLWAIGVLAFEMMTGRIPFQIKSEKQLSKIITSKIIFPNTMSSQAISFLQQMLVRDPQKRKNIQEVLVHSFLQKAKQK